MKEFFFENITTISIFIGVVCLFIIFFIINIIKNKKSPNKYKFDKLKINTKIKTDNHTVNNININGNGNNINTLSYTKIIISIIIIFLVILLGYIILTKNSSKNFLQMSFQSYPQTTISKETKDKQEIDDLFSSYTHGFVCAINYNDFSYIEKYLHENGAIYNELKEYILEYCQEHEVRETIVDKKITLYTPVQDGVYLIDTYEEYDIQTKNTDGAERKTFNGQYRVKKINGEWLMDEITIEHVPYN